MNLKTVTDKLDEGRQFRDIDVTSFERRSDEEGMTVTGYATVFNTEYDLYRFSEPGYTYVVREKVDPSAFAETDMRDVIMQYNHEGRVFARTSNGTLTVSPDDVGLRIRADLGGTELGRQVYEEINGGYTTKMSFGFRVAKDERNSTEVRDEETGVTTVTVVRTILAFEKLYDVSAVSLPANDATSISSRSYAEGVISEIKKEFLEREKRDRQRKRIKILTEVLK